MPPRRPVRRRRLKKATATVYFRRTRNELEHKQICVYASCDLGGTLVGPVWGHSDRSVKRVTAELSQKCDCPAKFHRVQDYQGRRVVKSTRRSL
jgi:hypothetical protein